MRMYHFLEVAAITVVLGVVAGCKGKTGNTVGEAKDSKASDYPVVEISEGLANASKYYSYVHEFVNGFAIVEYNDKMGLINLNGQEVAPCKYSRVERIGKAFATYEEDGWGHTKCGALDPDGNEILPCTNVAEDLHFFPDAETIVISSSYPDNYRFMDFKGKPLTERGMSVDYMRNSSDFIDDYAYVRWTKEFVDKSGKVVFKITKQNGISCLEDALGNVIIPKKYSDFGTYSCTYDSGILITSNNGFYGLWDIKNKKEIVPPTIYDYISCNKDLTGYEHFVNDGMIVVKIKSKYGVISKEGTEILNPQFNSLEIKKGLVIAQRDGGLLSESNGVYDSNGKELVPCLYSTILIGDNCIHAEKKDENYNTIYSLFDREGNLLYKSEKDIDYVGLLCEGLALIKKDGFYGYCEEDGDIIIEPKYEWAGDFSEGLAPVKKNGICGYVNHAGKDTFE